MEGSPSVLTVGATTGHVFAGTNSCPAVLAGFVTDRAQSKRTPFLSGLITMIAASLMFFLGTHIATVVAARALQGVSASLVWVSGLAYLTSRVEAKNVGVAMSSVTVAASAGELIGPLVGGVVYNLAGHFAVMALVCAILCADVVLRLMLSDTLEAVKQDGKLPSDEQQPLLGDPESFQHHQGITSMNEGLHDSSANHAGPDHQPPSDVDLKDTSYIEIFSIQFDKRLCASWSAALITGIIRFTFETVSPELICRLQN